MENTKKNEAWEKAGDLTHEIAGLCQNPPPPPSEPGLDNHDWMRITGLEPARLLTIEPKSIASANSAITAY